jgi:hypothetical protein
MFKLIKESLLLEKFETYIKFQGELYELHINPSPHDVLPNSRFITDKEGNLYSLFSPSSKYQNLTHGTITIILRAKGYPVHDAYGVGTDITLALQRYEKTNKLYLSESYNSVEDINEELFNKCKEKNKQRWIFVKKKIQYGEDVNESISFQRGVNPKVSLGVGQIYLIKKWLDEMKIEDYIINDDMTIDVNGNLNLWKSGLDGNLPEYIQFHSISGYFDISNCNLTTLQGCPKYIGFYFSCGVNKIKSLKGGPEEIFCRKHWENSYGYSASNNHFLVSLEGLPKKIAGNLWVRNAGIKFLSAEIRKVCVVLGNVDV